MDAVRNLEVTLRSLGGGSKGQEGSELTLRVSGNILM